MGDCVICICSWCKKEFGTDPAACQISECENCEPGTYLSRCTLFLTKLREREQMNREQARKGASTHDDR